MKHRTGHSKLGRPSAQRRALLLSLTRNLLQHERIKTTLPKAKALRPFIEKLITLGRRNTSGSKQRLVSVLPDPALRNKITDELNKRYQDRPGGYTRIIKTGSRYGDYAPMALIELLDSPQKTKEASKETA